MIWLPSDCRKPRMAAGMCCINIEQMAPSLDPKWLLQFCLYHYGPYEVQPFKNC